MSDIYTDHMTRVPKEGQRLNLQCDLMTECIGYVLHPSIALPAAARIADIGTGTARFLFQLQPTLSPEALLEGFDISTALFPPEDVLPANITLGQHDMKQPFPEHMHGQYDLVHARMLVAAMEPDDWDLVVRNFVQLLKPGGYLQWEECNFPNASWINPRANVHEKEDVGEMMIRQMTTSLGSRLEHGWKMESAGLTSITSDVASTDKNLRTREGFTEIILTLVFLWARLTKERGSAAFEQDIDDLDKIVQKETESGCHFKYNIHVACGQKPQ
ncbi:S-adenosyl-L-methionine-dependent methyltransferase [Xylariaceae sp. FL0255]|nr:S-adenosyl-L-methionine-dependent methyltransferase [Xylariaceae sp. FL0255]